MLEGYTAHGQPNVAFKVKGIECQAFMGSADYRSRAAAVRGASPRVLCSAVSPKRTRLAPADYATDRDLFKVEGSGLNEWLLLALHPTFLNRSRFQRECLKMLSVID